MITWGRFKSTLFYYFFISLIKAKFNFNTFTVCSPKIPNTLGFVFFSINRFKLSLDRFVFFATLSTCNFAAFTEICGSSPDPDWLMISSGISSFDTVGFSFKNLSISSSILFFKSGLLTAKFLLPEANPSYLSSSS